MTKNQLKVLISLWDKGPATAGQLGFDPYILNKLCGMGFAERLTKRPLSYVGKSKTLYQLSDKGRKECVLTGKRFVVTIGA